MSNSNLASSASGPNNPAPPVASAGNKRKRSLPGNPGMLVWFTS
jgi:hypothetical protein